MDIDAGQPARHGIEPGSEDENVEVMLAGGRLDPAARHRFDRGFAEIDKAHIGLIEDLIEVLFERRPFGAIGMKRLGRCEDLGNGRILDPRPRLVAPKIVGGAVRLFVRKEVVERANPGRKATDLPNAFERRSPLIFGHLGRGLFEEFVVEAAERRVAFLVGAWITLLHAADGVVVQLPLSHRQSQIGRALEYGEVGRDAGGFLGYLNAACPRADHPDSLASQVKTLLGPKRSVMALPGEIAQPRQLRYVGLRTQASAEHKIASARDRAIAGTDSPTIARRIKLGFVHAPVEANIPTKVEFLVHVVEIRADFLPRGIEFAELPVSPQVVARKLVHRTGRIDASPRITIPIPDATRGITGLEQLDGHAHAAQTVKEVESGKSRTYQDDIEIFDLAVFRPFRLSRAHVVQFLRRFASDCREGPSSMSGHEPALQ